MRGRPCLVPFGEEANVQQGRHVVVGHHLVPAHDPLEGGHILHAQARDMQRTAHVVAADSLEKLQACVHSSAMGRREVHQGAKRVLRLEAAH